MQHANSQVAQVNPVRWTIRDVIFLALIGVFFGIIYQLWSYVYYALAATPLKPYANDMTIGVWIMAGPLAGVLLRKVGASVIGELLAAAVEMMLFSSWGAADLISGFIQGIGNELGFAATGYKNWEKLGLLMSTIGATIVTFAWDWFQSGYKAYTPTMNITLLIIRFVSIGFFSGVLVYWIRQLVAKIGLLK